MASVAVTESRVPRWNALVALGLFAGWLIIGRIVPTFALAPRVSAWYPPAALLAAAVTLWGWKALMPIIMAAAVNAMIAPGGAEPLWRVILISAIGKAVYWPGAFWLRRERFDVNFTRGTDVARFAVAFALTAAVGAAVAVLDGQSSGLIADRDTAGLLRSFWAGDVVAVFALAPAMLVIASWAARAEMRGGWTVLSSYVTRRDLLQLLSIPVTITGAALLLPSLGFFSYALCVVPLTWIALVHGPRVTAVANVVSVVGALWSVGELGTLATENLTVQAFVIMLVVTSLLVAAMAGERERASALLADSESRYRQLVETLPDPVMVHVGGRVAFANGASATVFGAESVAALIGRPVEDLVAPRSRELVVTRIRDMAEGKRLPLARHTIQRLDGSGTAEVEVISVPFNFEGRDAVLSVSRDVTARILLEDQLRDAARMESVGRLAGGIAHDFNNLLTVITSYSELILAGLLPDESLAHDVREIHHAANRAASLTRQLLSFSRRQVVKTSPLDVSASIRSTEALLRRLIGPEIEIVSALDPLAGWVLADRGQLEQVIVNLAVNARDAMPDGGTLTLETRGVPASDSATLRCAVRAERYVMLVVRDTGEGIPSATLSRIFDPFFTTKDIGHGTGLGLATVHGIVEQAGGVVLVDSTIGMGSEFRVLLPALSGPPPVADSAPGRSQAGTSRRHGLVLLVEDEASVRAIARRALTGAGYDVVEAENGAEALEVLERDHAAVDLVLSDVAMPRVDGRHLSRQVLERWPGLPIVLMSGYADPHTIGESAPGVPLLLKPFAGADLLSAVATAIAGAAEHKGSTDTRA